MNSSCYHPKGEIVFSGSTNISPLIKVDIVIFHKTLFDIRLNWLGGFFHILNQVEIPNVTRIQNIIMDINNQSPSLTCLYLKIPEKSHHKPDKPAKMATALIKKTCIR